MARKKNPASRHWRESQFERWFLRHPVLPDGDRLRFIGKHRPLHRDVDLLALDAKGGLVIIEVKNERSTRALIGQALEYLSQYQRASLEELHEQMREQFGDHASKLFGVRSNRNLRTLSPRRRVILVARSFDPATGVCVRYLSQHFEKAVTFRLMTAERCGRDFKIAFYATPKLVPSSQLVGRFGETVKGRLYFVLAGGARPILWNVGLKQDGALRLPSQQAISLRLLRRMSRHLVRVRAVPWVSRRLQGTVWRNRKSSAQTAKLLGVVTPDPSSRNAVSWAMYARFKRGKFARYRRRRWPKFVRDWERVEEPVPEWSACFGRVPPPRRRRSAPR
jgi:hypothetical protein